MIDTCASIADIAVKDIVAGNNDRHVFCAEDLQSLADSIAQNGLVQPITVRDMGGQYQIIAGERRFIAVSQILQRSHITCMITEANDEKASRMMLAENTARIDLNPIDEALAYDKRMSEFNISINECAVIAGVSPERVKRRLLLLSLLPEIQHLVTTNNLSIGHAECLAKLDSNRQLLALRLMQESKTPLGIQAFKAICQQLKDEQDQDKLFDLSEYWRSQLASCDNLPKRGKMAITGAPTRHDLPVFDAKMEDHVGSIFDKLISACIQKNKHDEAATLGTLYDFLVRGNWARVPDDALLLRQESIKQDEFLS